MEQKISKYRNSIMGIAILWIMLHHSGINLPGPLFAIKRSGFGGVDLFLFLSGFGCAVSLAKNSIIEFYKRRAIRIYPHYIPILVVFLIIHEQGKSILAWMRDILGNITGFSMWSLQGLRFNWYMTAIVLFYILSPIFYEMLIRYKVKGLVWLVIISFVADFCFAPVSEYTIAISRFTIFIIGMYCGVTIRDGGKIPDNRKTRIMLYMICITGFIALFLTYKYQNLIPEEYYNVFVPFILIVPGLTVFFCKAFETIEKKGLGGKIIKGLDFCGKISLDIYLIHIVFFGIIGEAIEGVYDITKPHPISVKNVLIWIVISVCTILIAYVYKMGINKLITKHIKKCE